MNKRIQRMMQDLKSRTKLYMELEAACQQEQEAIAQIRKELAAWAREALPEGGRYTFGGVTVERRAEPRVEFDKGVNEDQLASQLESKLPSLVLTERKLNREAIIQLGDRPETMKRLGELGVKVVRPLVTVLKVK